MRDIRVRLKLKIEFLRLREGTKRYRLDGGGVINYWFIESDRIGMRK